MFPTEPVPERVGAYKIVRRAQGTGSTKVYVARKEGPMGFARLYTLKLVPNTAEGDARFAQELAREAAICSTLNHQAIQRMIDFFEHDKHLVLVLEHIEGTTLERLVTYLDQNKKPLSDAVKAYIGREVAGALVHAHAARDENGKPMPIVHRGVHPEHVLLGWDGQVRLSGFGLGKILGRSPDTVVAKKIPAGGFKAPELLRGDSVTPKADVYGLGLLLWSLFTGQKPSDKGIKPARLAIVRSNLLKSVSTAIDAALETSVDKRPASCRDIETALGLVPGIEAGREELCAKLDLLRQSPPGPDSVRPSVSAVSRPRIALQSIRPSEPAESSKERLSTTPATPPQSIRPPVSLPPILFDDVQPKSVYPLLKALAEKIPKSEGGVPKVPRLPYVESPPSSTQEAETQRAPRSGVPKLEIATPIELGVKITEPRTEWIASVPDEEVFEKLFDEVTSRTPEELETAGVGLGVIEVGPESAGKVRRRMELADTLPVRSRSAAKPINALINAPIIAPIIKPIIAPIESKPVVTPPLGPPPEITSKAIRFGPPPETPTPPKLKRGFAPPPLPQGQSKRPSMIVLAGVSAVVAICAALLVLAFSDKPDDSRNGAASASASAKNAPVPSATASAKPGASTAASAESPPPPLPFGQGYITVAYPDEALVYVSGRKLGKTNTRLQNRCGPYFVRIAKSTSGAYPEWLSAGESVKIPCQDSVQITISR